MACGGLDLDDVGAPVRELAHGGRAGAHPGEIEHGEARERHVGWVHGRAIVRIGRGRGLGEPAEPGAIIARPMLRVTSTTSRARHARVRQSRTSRKRKAYVGRDLVPMPDAPETRMIREPAECKLDGEDMAHAIDTLRITRKLESAGVERRQAEAHAEALNEVAVTEYSELATKTDLERFATKEDLTRLETRMFGCGPSRRSRSPRSSSACLSSPVDIESAATARRPQDNRRLHARRTARADTTRKRHPRSTAATVAPATTAAIRPGAPSPRGIASQ